MVSTETYVVRITGTVARAILQVHLKAANKAPMAVRNELAPDELWQVLTLNGKKPVAQTRKKRAQALGYVMDALTALGEQVHVKAEKLETFLKRHGDMAGAWRIIADEQLLGTIKATERVVGQPYQIIRSV